MTTSLIAGSAAWRDAVRAAYIFAVDKDDPTRRLLMPVKWNLPAFETTTIPFRQVELSDADAERVLLAPQFSELNADGRSTMRRQLRRLEFDPPETIDADEAMAPAKSNDGPGDCETWILDRLGTEYAWPDPEIEAEAIAAKFSPQQYRKGKAKLKPRGLRSKPAGFGLPWLVAFGDVRTMPIRPQSTQGSVSAETDQTEQTDQTDQTGGIVQSNQSNQSNQCNQSTQCAQGESRDDEAIRLSNKWNDDCQQRQRDKDGEAASKPKAPRKRKDGAR